MLGGDSEFFKDAIMLDAIQGSMNMFNSTHRLKSPKMIDFKDEQTKQKNEITLKDYNPYSVEGFGNKGLSWNIAFMDNILRKETPLLNALTYISNKSMKNGIDLNLKDGKDFKRSIELNDEFHKLFKKALTDFVFLGDGYGGAGCLIVLDGLDNEEELLTPLTEDKIKKGQDIYLRPLTRLYQIQPDYSRPDNYITKIGKEEGIYDDTELGKPKYYRVTISGDMFTNKDGDYSFSGTPAFSKSYLVHRSRLLVYNGSPLTWIEQNIEQFFGISKVEKVIEPYKNYKLTLDELLKLLKRSNIPTLLIDGISGTSKIGDMGVEMIDEALLSYAYAIKNGDAVVMGKDEDLKYAQVVFRDLNEQLLARKKEVKASANAPLEVMFGDKGEEDDSDNDFYIKDIQERQLMPAYKQLLPLLHKSIYGDNIGSYTVIFKSLESTTEKEKIDKLKVATDIITTLFDKNIITVVEAINLLTSANDNVGDMLYNLSMSVVDLGEDGKKKAKDYQIEVANELQTAHLKEQITNGSKKDTNGYNPTESAIGGKLKGGDKELTKKNNIDIK